MYSAGHLIENFQREKLTVDQISKLSSEEMELSGVNDRNAVMNLRLECLNYGSNPPSRKPGKQVCGTPENLISKSVLEGYLEDGFNIKDITSLLSVSESSVYRRMGCYRGKLLDQLQGISGAVWSGDGRFDSMGHCAKYGTYTMFSCDLMKIVNFDNLQVSNIIMIYIPQLNPAPAYTIY